MKTRKAMGPRLGPAAALCCGSVAALVAGCPGFEIEDVALASSSADDAAFTLAATVVVIEEDPAVDDDGDLSGGRGLLGLWLPPGWSVGEARIQAPGDEAFAPLPAIPDGDGHFPAPFPWVPGAWSAFASPCQNLEEGTFEYLVEADVSGPAGATEVVLGVSTALLDEEGSGGAPPVEARVDLVAGTVEVREGPAAPGPTGLEACAAVPYEEPAGEGCSCAAPGAVFPAGAGPMAALLAALR